MSNEMRIHVLIALCLFLAYISIVGRYLITCLKDKPFNSLEGENQDVNS
ncbi:hypothetical protein PBI_INGRID_54 [Arthrobacter phage Ingrid]|nr:hypothetical protein PBI_INGRID_54 [Arthrobacter phage Ingrid]